MILENHAVLRDIYPRLRAARPDMTDWNQPSRIIERARLQYGDLFVDLRIMRNTSPANRTYIAIENIAAAGLA